MRVEYDSNQLDNGAYNFNVEREKLLFPRATGGTHVVGETEQPQVARFLMLLVARLNRKACRLKQKPEISILQGLRDTIYRVTLFAITR